jgi:hypothetical protein
VAALLFACAAHAQEDPVKQLELRLDGQCDAANGRLWLVNNHASKAIIAQLSWSLANSKRVIKDQFQIAAQSKIEVGCAARAEITGAQFVP